jgi:hypothetical protein
LNALLPERFAQDLYFKFGSQDSLTFFSRLYGPVVAAFGPAGGHFCATVLGAAAFVAALIYFMHSLFAERRQVIGAIIACIALDASYGGLNVFRYGEAFGTPRIFAEALVMAALASCMRERLMVSVLCLLAATTIHPAARIKWFTGLYGTDDAAFRAWHYWIAGIHRIGQHDHMKPCHRHKLPEIDAHFEALFPSGRPPAPARKDGYADGAT